jgi:general secretion pathway protein G
MESSNMRRDAQRSRRALRRAFTLLELIIVVSIIGILAAIAVPNYLQTPVRAKEAVLKTNLRTLREVIDQHKADKGTYPGSLEELVEKGYLRRVPDDPFTGAPDWTLVYEEVDEEEAPPETEETEEGGPGIDDVHSSSTGTSLDGTPYAEW